MPKTYALPPGPPHNHGGTVAAWSLMAGVVLGSVIIAVGMAMSSSLVLIIGAVVIVASLALGLVLRAAGMGQKRRGAAQRTH